MTGANPPPAARALAGPAVDFVGFTPDLRTVYETARVVVVPMRFGAGVKVKCIEALQYGVPVVSTSVGAEGLGLHDSRAVIVADDAGEFAAALLALYEGRTRGAPSAGTFSASSSAGANNPNGAGDSFWQLSLESTKMHHGTPAREDESTVIPLRGRAFPEIAVAVVDPNDLNSPHTLAVLSIPPGATVLDVGCGPGVVARALTARGCKVWGLERDPARANSARNHCVEVLEADVEAVSLSEEFAGQSFDVVLFLDVLEHLRDPQAALAGADAVLAPGGCVLLSVPNVTHGALRLELLSGKFRYRASGLLDRGHLRFFDADGLDAMIRQAGFRSETRLRVMRRLDQTEFDIDLTSIPDDLRTTLESDLDALTYQFFVIARPAHGPQSVTEGVTLLERQQARIAELSAAIEKGAAYARHLQEELSAKDARLREIEGSVVNADQARFGELAAAIEQGAAYARHLQEELSAKDARLREIEGSVASADQARFGELAAAIEQGAAYARHLHEELSARDARLQDLEGAVVNAERARFDELVAAIETGGVHATHLREDLATATARLAELQGTLTNAEREIAAKTARHG